MNNHSLEDRGCCPAEKGGPNEESREWDYYTSEVYFYCAFGDNRY